MKVPIAAIITGFAAMTFLCGCCQKINNSPICGGVKTYERYSDEIGKKRDVKLLGKDVVVEPEADKKIRIDF